MIKLCKKNTNVASIILFQIDIETQTRGGFVNLSRCIKSSESRNKIASLKGDTAILLAQKLPLPSSRLIEQLKYWKLETVSLACRRHRFAWMWWLHLRP